MSTHRTINIRLVGTAVFPGLVAVLSPIVVAAGETTANEPCLYDREIGTRSLCIRQQSFNTDLCQTIGHVADIHGVPPAFFARLIWRESLFRPDAVSSKGAEGIAQFMPATAKRRGLDNSFDVIDALDASAAYLKALEIRFGNFGACAAAYNAGENGFARFLSTGALPIETRDYVFAITGHTIEAWQASPPSIAAPKLDETLPFQDACIALAETRQMKEPVFEGSADWAPWGVQLAAHYRPSVVDRLFTRTINSLPAPLNEERALIVRQRGGNFGHRPRYAARIGRETREAAVQLCDTIRAASVPCTVFRNRR